jgi:hypothetical protein
LLMSYHMSMCQTASPWQIFELRVLPDEGHFDIFDSSSSAIILTLISLFAYFPAFTLFDCSQDMCDLRARSPDGFDTIGVALSRDIYKEFGCG